MGKVFRPFLTKLTEDLLGIIKNKPTNMEFWRTAQNMSKPEQRRMLEKQVLDAMKPAYNTGRAMTYLKGHPKGRTLGDKSSTLSWEGDPYMGNLGEYWWAPDSKIKLGGAEATQIPWEKVVGTIGHETGHFATDEQAAATRKIIEYMEQYPNWADEVVHRMTQAGGRYGRHAEDWLRAPKEAIARDMETRFLYDVGIDPGIIAGKMGRMHGTDAYLYFKEYYGGSYPKWGDKGINDSLNLLYRTMFGSQ
jgi:hypothetical protein